MPQVLTLLLHRPLSLPWKARSLIARGAAVHLRPPRQVLALFRGRACRFNELSFRAAAEAAFRPVGPREELELEPGRKGASL